MFFSRAACFSAHLLFGLPMLHTDPSSQKTIGADLRALRRARGLSLAQMAGSLGRSVGWLSQVERNISEASVADLRQMATLFGVPVSILFGEAGAPRDEQGFIVRKSARRRIGDKDGLIEELLSPDLTDDFEVVHSTFQPGANLAEPAQRATQELGYLIAGKLDLVIAGRHFTVHPGDSFRMRGESFRWSNPYKVKAVAIWVIAPPVY